MRSLGRYEEAEQAYRHAIELDPRCDNPWNGPGNVLQDIGRSGEAEQAYHRAIELGPEFPYPWGNLARLLESGGYKAGRGAERLPHRSGTGFNGCLKEIAGSANCPLCGSGRTTRGRA